jgi:two-component system, chemotaxis family, protein-glutamate methylesterase/glutaminase
VTTASTPRVLICEDSRTYAVALRRVLVHGGEIDVVGVCATAEEAIAALPRLEPTLLTMDINLPGMSGLEAVERIMGVRPLPILVLGSDVRPGSELAAAALAAGAIEASAKGDFDLDPASAAAATVRERVKLLSHAHVIRHPRGRLNGRSRRPSAAHPASVIAVCASTGGPQVLARMLAALPAEFPIPVLVVQHIAEGFTDGLAGWLDRVVPMSVRVAEARRAAGAGVWIAPEGAHVKLEPSGLLALDRRTNAGVHRPSGNILFESVAAAAGRRSVAIVLSGMGNDGAAGAAAVKRCGGLAIAQDEESCAVYGMPKAAVAGGVDLVLNPEEIVTCLRSLRHVPLVVKT